jgi:hypothetical protein
MEVHTKKNFDINYLQNFAYLTFMYIPKSDHKNL